MRYAIALLSACTTAHGGSASTARSTAWREVDCWADSEGVFAADMSAPAPIAAWVSNGESWREADYAVIHDDELLFMSREASGYDEACRLFLAE